MFAMKVWRLGWGVSLDFWRQYDGSFICWKSISSCLHVPTTSLQEGKGKLKWNKNRTSNIGFLFCSTSCDFL